MIQVWLQRCPRTRPSEVIPLYNNLVSWCQSRSRDGVQLCTVLQPGDCATLMQQFGTGGEREY